MVHTLPISDILPLYDDRDQTVRQMAEHLAAVEIWRRHPSSKPAAGPLSSLSTEWFQHLEYKRYRRHGHWIPELLSFPRHQGERILALGDGLGTEWACYAEAGANVTVCDPNAQRLQLLKHHFHVRALPGTFVQTPFDRMPSDDDRQDVVSFFFHEPLSFALSPVFSEAFRVLRPGGKLIAVLPADANAAHWQHYALPWRWWQSIAKTGQAFRSAQLRPMLAMFEEVYFFKRHLRRSELAHVWRWIPLPIMERLMGRFLIVKAFKSVQAARRLRIAA